MDPVAAKAVAAKAVAAKAEAIARIFDELGLANETAEEKDYEPYFEDYNLAIILGRGCAPYVVHLGMYLDLKLRVPGFSYTNYALDHMAKYVDEQSSGEVLLQVVVYPSQFDEIALFAKRQLHGACRILWFDDYMKELGCTFESMVDIFDGHKTERV